jgi:hypothetical protein
METQLEALAVGAVIFGAGSEIIGMSKLKSNSWVQLLLQFGRIFFSARRR